MCIVNNNIFFFRSFWEGLFCEFGAPSPKMKVRGGAHAIRSCRRMFGEGGPLAGRVGSETAPGGRRVIVWAPFGRALGHPWVAVLGF